MTSTFDRVLDELGTAIVHGELPAWNRYTIDGFVERTGASRSIVREAVRVLVGAGLVLARRRTGLTVLPAGCWEVLDPRVVGWQLSGPDRARVLDDLRALRRAVEPAAASAAAAAAVRAAHESGGHGDGNVDEHVHALLSSAALMATVTGPDDAATFLQADREVHRRILRLADNAFFTRLGEVTAQALDERSGIGPQAHDVDLHVRLAHEVARGDAEAAASTMTELIDRTVL